MYVYFPNCNWQWGTHMWSNVGHFIPSTFLDDLMKSDVARNCIKKMWLYISVEGMIWINVNKNISPKQIVCFILQRTNHHFPHSPSLTISQHDSIPTVYKSQYLSPPSVTIIHGGYLYWSPAICIIKDFIIVISTRYVKKIKMRWRL
jgi:hypothetical protein